MTWATCCPSQATGDDSSRRLSLDPTTAYGIQLDEPRHGDHLRPVDLPPIVRDSVSGAKSQADAVFEPVRIQRGVPVTPWWGEVSQAPVSAPPERSCSVDLETLIQAALQHSPFVQAALTTTQIVEADINFAKSDFDPTRFAESIFRNTSDPVGNTLTTGGPPRLDEIGVDNSIGVRRKNSYGGRLEASQDVMLRDNNSLFFLPRQQADTKLAIRYTQPMMRGAGQFYNRSNITLAEVAYGVSLSEARRSLQQRAVDITQTYWELYAARSKILQIQRGLERLNHLIVEVEQRRDFDGIPSQIYLASAIAANQRARLVRVKAAAATAEIHLRRLVNAPWLTEEACDELVPQTPPFSQWIPINAKAEIASALENRPDILAIRDRIQASTIRLKVSENELKPTLNLVTSLYVRGLEGDYDAARAFGNQFADGRPSVTGGLNFQRPRNNLAAEAIRRQKSLELQKLLFELDDLLLKASAEIHAAVAESNASFAELEAARDSAFANAKNVEYLSDRWTRGSFFDSTSPMLQLQQLLNAENELILAENNWATAEANYMIALAILKFRSGDLLAVRSE